MASLFNEPRQEAQGAVIDIPWTLDRAVAVFLNRWCHRAMGDREVAERELRELIELAIKVPPN